MQHNDGDQSADDDSIRLSVHEANTVDRATAATMLVRELVREGIAASVNNQPGPVGSKSGSFITTGSLLISGSLSVQMIRSITRIVLAAIRRDLVGKIRIDDCGRKIEIENATRDTEKVLISWLTQSTMDNLDEKR